VLGARLFLPCSARRLGRVILGCAESNDSSAACSCAPRGIALARRWSPTLVLRTAGV